MGSFRAFLLIKYISAPFSNVMGELMWDIFHRDWGRGPRISLSVNGDGHPDDLEGCSMQLFCTRSLSSFLPIKSCHSCTDRQESLSSHCKKIKLTVEKLSGVRHLCFKHREGKNLVYAIFRNTLLCRTNRKKTFQAFAEKARTSQLNLAVQFSPKWTMESNKGLRTLLGIKNSI